MSLSYSNVLVLVLFHVIDYFRLYFSSLNVFFYNLSLAVSHCEICLVAA